MEQARLAVKTLDIPAPEGAPEKTVTISLGGSIVNTSDGFEFEPLFERVDRYLYAAKEHGKDVCCLDGEFVKKK